MNVRVEKTKGDILFEVRVEKPKGGIRFVDLNN